MPTSSLWKAARSSSREMVPLLSLSACAAGDEQAPSRAHWVGTHRVEQSLEVIDRAAEERALAGGDGLPQHALQLALHLGRQKSLGVVVRLHPIPRARPAVLPILAGVLHPFAARLVERQLAVRAHPP